MGRINATGDSGTPESSWPAGDNGGVASFPPKADADPVESYPPKAEAGGTPATPPAPLQFIGSPWSTNLFDCHEDQTNGIYLISFLHFQSSY